MSSREEKRHFPPPWSAVRLSEDAFGVQDANGFVLLRLYCRDDLHKANWVNCHAHLTSDEARRLAKGIARLPEFLMAAPGFDTRGGGDRRWRPSHPYHVALEDAYVRANWDEIDARCRYNNVPFDPTGELIEREGRWCVYEFKRQVDALMFWDAFEGRWLRYGAFFYPDRPPDMPTMKPLPVRHPFDRRKPGR